MTWLCPFCRTRYSRGDAPCVHDNTPLIVDRTGQVLGGRFTVKELIGVGRGASTVWEAQGSEGPVALRLDPSSDADFLTIATKSESIQHQHIVRVVGHGQSDDNIPFLALELLEGQTLAEALTDRQPIPPNEAFRIIDQVLSAIEFAHERGIDHVNIKPSYVFLTPTSKGTIAKLRLLGLGVRAPLSAKIVDEADSSHLRRETLLYSAPEQLAAGMAIAQTDQYAIGVLLFHMLTGRPPFEPEKDTALARAHLLTKAPTLAFAFPGLDVPDSVEAVLARTLSKRPQERYASTSALREALHDAQSSSSAHVSTQAVVPTQAVVSTQATTSSPIADLDEPALPRRSRWLPALIALLALGGIAFFILQPKTPVKNEQIAQQDTLKTASTTPPPIKHTPTAPLPSDAAPPPPVDASPPKDTAPPPKVTITQVPKPATKPSAIELISTPAGAVLTDARGNTLGTTPWVGTLPAGRHIITASIKGYLPSSAILDVGKKGGRMRSAFQLKRKPQLAIRPVKKVTKKPPTIINKPEVVATPAVAAKPDKPKDRVRVLGEGKKTPKKAGNRKKVRVLGE